MHCRCLIVLNCWLPCHCLLHVAQLQANFLNPAVLLLQPVAEVRPVVTVVLCCTCFEW